MELRVISKLAQKLQIKKKIKEFGIIQMVKSLPSMDEALGSIQPQDQIKAGMAYACNHSTWKVEAGVWVQSYPCVYGELKASLSYINCLKKKIGKSMAITIFYSKTDYSLSNIEFFS